MYMLPLKLACVMKTHMGVFENQEPLKSPEVARVYKPKCIKLKKKNIWFGIVD